jgi:hypothetical protein
VATTAARPEHPTRRGFWYSLDLAEREALAASATERVFSAGTAICRQEDVTDDVIVIKRGWTTVSAKFRGHQRIIAVRGPGDIVGDRAAVAVATRSATVTALDNVLALVVPATRFGALLIEYPHMLEVLDRQEYERLAEDAAGIPDDELPSPARRLTELCAVAPLNCSIFYSDIVAFGGPQRDDDDRRVVRRALYQILEQSFEGSNVPWTNCRHEDRGDGVLTVVGPTVSTVSLVDPLLALLAAKLRRYNRQAGEPVRIQLRVALHVGPVSSDDNGLCGQAIIHTARLLVAPVVKASLARTGADLAVITSSHVYDTVIRNGPGFVDPAAYLPVQVQVKEANATGWLHLAGAAVPAGRARNRPQEP